MKNRCDIIFCGGQKCPEKVFKNSIYCEKHQKVVTELKKGINEKIMMKRTAENNKKIEEFNIAVDKENTEEYFKQLEDLNKKNDSYIKDELLDKYHECNDNLGNSFCECDDENIDLNIINNIKKEALNQYHECIYFKKFKEKIINELRNAIFLGNVGPCCARDINDIIKLIKSDFN